MAAVWELEQESWEKYGQVGEVRLDGGVSSLLSDFQAIYSLLQQESHLESGSAVQ